LKDVVQFKNSTVCRQHDLEDIVIMFLQTVSDSNPSRWCNIQEYFNWITVERT